MFTGDAGNNVLKINTLEEYADKMGISLKVDMLKYPHHGNEYLNDNFLSTTKPTYVVVPNNNAGQYPTENNMNRLKNIGATIYRQSDYKNILFRTSNGGYDNSKYTLFNVHIFAMHIRCI